MKHVMTTITKKKKIFITVALVLLLIGLGLGVVSRQSSIEQNIERSKVKAKQEFPVYLKRIQDILTPYRMTLVPDEDDFIYDDKWAYSENYHTEGNPEYELEISLSFSEGVKFFDIFYDMKTSDMSKIKQGFDYNLLCSVVNAVSVEQLKVDEVKDFLENDKYLKKTDVYMDFIEIRQKSMNRFGTSTISYFLDRWSNNIYNESLSFRADLLNASNVSSGCENN